MKEKWRTQDDEISMTRYDETKRISLSAVHNFPIKLLTLIDARANERVANNKSSLFNHAKPYANNACLLKPGIPFSGIKKNGE